MMGIWWAELGCMLIIILAASQIFTNAVEYLGQHFRLSAGVVGSLFAAVATALPETTVPVIAILAGGHNQQVNEEISMGAILGAPLMLSTISIFLMTLAALKPRGLGGRVTPEKSGLIRDLNFFVLAFFLAGIAMVIPRTFFYWRAILCLSLLGLYILYALLTIKASKQLVLDGHGVAPGRALLLTKMGLPLNLLSIFAQLTLGLALLIVGAKGFIYGVEAISTALNVSALILSLLIVPIATELPEKVNSIFWIRQQKDTLAVGNITGAMVFQGCLLTALGIWFTPWEPSSAAITAIIISFLAAVWLRLNAKAHGISLLSLLVHGVFYLLYLGIVLR